MGSNGWWLKLVPTVSVPSPDAGPSGSERRHAPGWTSARMLVT